MSPRSLTEAERAHLFCYIASSRNFPTWQKMVFEVVYVLGAWTLASILALIKQCTISSVGR